jgi:uncharacterized integral membrane protein
MDPETKSDKKVAPEKNETKTTKKLTQKQNIGLGLLVVGLIFLIISIIFIVYEYIKLKSTFYPGDFWIMLIVGMGINGIVSLVILAAILTESISKSEKSPGFSKFAAVLGILTSLYNIGFGVEMNIQYKKAAMATLPKFGKKDIDGIYGLMGINVLGIACFIGAICTV